MSIFEHGESISDSIFAVNAESVGYYRDGTLLNTLLCKVGKALFKVDIAQGISIRYDIKDFIVRRTDLGQTIPQKGDIIHYGRLRYKVYAPSGEPCYRDHTGSGSQIRIHTMLDEETTAENNGGN